MDFLCQFRRSTNSLSQPRRFPTSRVRYLQAQDSADVPGIFSVQRRRETLLLFLIEAGDQDDTWILLIWCAPAFVCLFVCLFSLEMQHKCRRDVFKDWILCYGVSFCGSGSMQRLFCRTCSLLTWVIKQFGWPATRYVFVWMCFILSNMVTLQKALPKFTQKNIR